MQVDGDLHGTLPVRITVQPGTLRVLGSERGPVKSRQDSAFEIEFYEKVLHRDPTQIDALRQLGHLYTRSGRVRDGLRADLALAILCPTDSVAHYTRPRSYALVDDIERAFPLAEAIELGYGTSNT